LARLRRGADEKQFSTLASSSGESSRREAVPTAGYDPVTAAPLKRAEGLERRRSSAPQPGSPALSHPGFSVAKSMEASQRWGAVVTPVAAVRWLERRREVSGAVAKWLDAFQKLWRRRVFSGGVANPRETSQTLRGRREFSRSVAKCLEMSQILRRCRVSSGGVANHEETSQTCGTCRET
jgi:hypothetical protein